MPDSSRVVGWSWAGVLHPDRALPFGHLASGGENGAQQGAQEAEDERRESVVLVDRDCSDVKALLGVPEADGFLAGDRQQVAGRTGRDRD